MKRRCLNIAAAALDVLPGLAGFFIISGGGLPHVFSVTALEAMLMLIQRRLGCMAAGNEARRWAMLIVSTLGIIAGYFAYPHASSPASLGITALALVVILHAAAYAVLDGLLIRKK